MKRISIILFFSLLFISCNISVEDDKEEIEKGLKEKVNPINKVNKFSLELKFKDNKINNFETNIGTEFGLDEMPYIVEDLINKKTKKSRTTHTTFYLKEIKEFHLKITREAPLFWISLYFSDDLSEDAELQVKYWKDGKLEKDETIKGQKISNFNIRDPKIIDDSEIKEL